MFLRFKKSLKLRAISLLIVSEALFPAAGQGALQSNIQNQEQRYSEGVTRIGDHAFGLSSNENVYEDNYSQNGSYFSRPYMPGKRSGAWAQAEVKQIADLKIWVSRTHPNILDIAGTIPASAIMNVNGAYDHESDALKALGFNCTDVAQFNEKIDLRGVNVLVVNCGAVISQFNQERIKNFVREGGYLVTTDLEAGSLLHGFWRGDIDNRAIALMSHQVHQVHVENAESDLVVGTAHEGPWSFAGSQTSYLPDSSIQAVVTRTKKTICLRKSHFAAVVLSIHYGQGRILQLSGHFTDIAKDVVPEMGTSLRQAIFLNFIIAGLNRQRGVILGQT